MTTLKLSEAKAHLGRYARRAAGGDRYIISDHNKPLAVMGPCTTGTAKTRPKVGLMDGQARIPDDFDQALPSFEAEFYGP